MAVEFPMSLSQAALRAPQAPPIESKPGASTFARVLRAVGTQVDRGERLIHRVVSGHGGTTNAADLIALQAGIYRYIELVDLTSKFVDRAASAVRTTLQSGG